MAERGKANSGDDAIGPSDREIAVESTDEKHVVSTLWTRHQHIRGRGCVRARAARCCPTTDDCGSIARWIVGFEEVADASCAHQRCERIRAFDFRARRRFERARPADFQRAPLASVARIAG